MRASRTRRVLVRAHTARVSACGIEATVATTRTTRAATNPIVRVIGRLRHGSTETVGELRKVTWPDSQTTRNLTLVVIGISVAIGVLLGLTDSLLTALYTLLEKL